MPDPVNDTIDHLTHAKSLLSQVYYRQNMYVMSAQHCDAQDLNYYLGPIISITGIASFCGFLASSSLVADNADLRNSISLFSGFMGVMATTITALRNASKFDVKAEMFRGAAGQYRLLATRLEERTRTHRMLMQDPSWKDPKVKAEAIESFNEFFTSQYRMVLTAQSEMKYFPPNKAVAQWKKTLKLLPNEIDQPEVDRDNQQKMVKQFSSSIDP